jgi:ABC-2 type transport system permease protein
MRTFLTLLNRELRAYFYSPIAYVVMCSFLLATGFSFYMVVSALNRAPADVTVVEVFFQFVPFWICVLIILPLLTMRTFSEEFRMGTIEPLMTAPVGDLQVVLSKYFAALLFYIILWCPSVIYFYTFERITQGNSAPAGFALPASYLLVLLIGMFWLSIGCLASALTKNQIIAAVMSCIGVMVVFFAGLLSHFVLHVDPFFRDLVGYFSTIEHMSSFSRGVIDSRPIVFYLTATVFMLGLTFQVFQYRKWKA